jgi:sulfatase modifying factor 1
MSSIGSITFRSEQEVDYAVDTRGSFEKIARRGRSPQYRRSGTVPGSVNGIHRRRQSRWSWGHGRGARLENVRAFARCVIAVTAAIAAATASAATIGPMVPVGDPGNVGKAISSGTFGSVAQAFTIGKYEVSNAQYVEFLNAVAATDSLDLFNVSMTDFAQGGIERSGTPGSYSYAVKSNGPTNYADMPVNFVSVYSAARYVNWLHNGAPASPLDINAAVNTGAYTLPNLANANVALTRNPGATFFLPDRNEWFKAAFYDPSTSGYSLYASGTNAPPTVATASTNLGTNVGYFGQVASNMPMVVDGLGNTVSHYGAVGMIGNMSEWLETSTATQAYWIGGWYNMANTTTNLTNFASSSGAGALQSSMLQSRAQGFRIAAVPEPSTVAMAIVGLCAVAGTNVVRRRRQAMARGQA